MSDHNHSPNSELYDYLDNRLAPEDQRDLESRLETDPQLLQQLDQQRAIRDALRAIPAAEQLELGFSAEVLSRAREASTDSPATAGSTRSRIPAWASWAGWAAIAAALVFALSSFWRADETPSALPRDTIVDGMNQPPHVIPETPEPESPSQLVEDETQPREATGPGTVAVEALTGNKFLFVMEIGVTPQGVEQKVIDAVLMKQGIVYDKAIQIDMNLEKSLLETRFLDGIVRKPSDPGSEDQPVELVYLVCSGRQVDAMTADFHGRHGEVAAYRFNLAIMPGDMKVFGDLEKTIASQWKPAENTAGDKPSLAGFKNRAGRLLMDLVLLSGMGRELTTTVLSSEPEIPAPPHGAEKRGTLKVPNPGTGVLGEDLVCEMLLVVRRMSQKEADKLNQK